MVRFSNTACNAGQRVGISAQRNRLSDGILVVFGFQETYDSLRHCALATLVPVVVSIPVGICLVKVIAESFLNVVQDFFFGLPGSRQKDSCRSGLGALDSLRMIVGESS